MKLLKAERQLAAEVTEGLDDLPLHLTHRVAVYAKMLNQWERSARKINSAEGAERYKLAQECSMFAKQFEVAGQAIERERERQRARKESTQRNPAGNLRTYLGS